MTKASKNNSTLLTIFIAILAILYFTYNLKETKESNKVFSPKIEPDSKSELPENNQDNTLSDELKTNSKDLKITDIQPGSDFDSVPDELPEDLKQQLNEPAPPLPDDLRAQLESPPPAIPPDIEEALKIPPREVSIDEVNNPTR